MIVSRLRGELLVVAQPDHGTQTGLIAGLWGNDVSGRPTHGDAPRLAARHHDDGWAVWERRPTLNPTTRQPIQFFDVHPDEHLAAYRAGIQRAAQIDPWAGLLVSMHGAGLYNDRYGSYRLEEIGEQTLSTHERALVDQFLTDMADLQRDLYAAATGHTALTPPPELPEVRAQYLLLQVWDRISLQFALRHAADGRIRPLPAGSAAEQLTCTNAGTFRLRLDPYPFVDDRVALPVQVRRLADRTYTDPEDFLAAMAAAPVDVLECEAVR